MRARIVSARTSKRSFRGGDTDCHKPKCCARLGRMRIGYGTHWHVISFEDCTWGNYPRWKKMGANIVLMLLPFCPAKTALISRLMLCATSPILKTPKAGHSNGKLGLRNLNMSSHTRVAVLPQHADHPWIWYDKLTSHDKCKRSETCNLWFSFSFQMPLPFCKLYHGLFLTV